MVMAINVLPMGPISAVNSFWVSWMPFSDESELTPLTRMIKAVRDKQPNNEYWPADMKTGDYSSAQFIRRVKRLILRLGECWDNDPRVAWTQMGIIGYWGEQHSPAPTPEMQKILGDTFSKAFKNKK